METESHELAETSSYAHSFVLPPPEEELDYPFLLNKVLPEEIRVLGWRPVPDSFHARFSTSYREYKYFIVSTGPNPQGRSQIRNDGALVPRQNLQHHSQQEQQQQQEGWTQEDPQVEEVDFDLCSLDIARMREAAQHFVGEHDFRNFCKPDVLAVRSFVRRIMSFEIEPVDASCTLGGDSASSNGRSQVYVMTIKGTAFLWHQVRCMAAVLLLVGRGLEEPGIVARMLDLKAFPAKPQYAMAPEEPLLLHDCGYSPPLTFLPPRGPNSSNSISLCSMVERHLIGAALCAAITARAYKREAEGLDGSVSSQSNPQREHGNCYISQQQQASASSGVCDRSHNALIHSKSREGALHEGHSGGRAPGPNGISSYQAECSDSGRGRRHPGGQQGPPGDAVGRRFVRNYVPLSLRKMEQSIEERLQKHGLVNTDAGFQRFDEEAE
ncbi:pseudouridine synthase [Dunaliella salina]|uniref:tRNA pseudouridine synthase n=1 Tax=Dunaliella salina TaxID=3046 RepID=A0ABQ7G6R3_DUNSA|nr:pseudouridine synthase [Dunaliella salina]|eukprot:KAF5830302.1 pseudouridine synthase [Dunaliella salina]